MQQKKVRYFLNPTPYSTNGWSMLNWITISFENLSWLANFAPNMCPLTYKLSTSSPKVCLDLYFNFFEPSSTSLPIWCSAYGEVLRIICLNYRNFHIIKEEKHGHTITATTTNKAHGPLYTHNIETFCNLRNFLE